MRMIEYWPSLKNINECIRTEAEELAEYTLLAVHQPVNLLRRDKDGNNLDMRKKRICSTTFWKRRAQSR